MSPSLLDCFSSTFHSHLETTTTSSQDLPLGLLRAGGGDHVDAGGPRDAGRLGLLPSLFAHLAEVLPQVLFRSPVGEREVQPLGSEGEGQAALTLGHNL